MTFEVDFRPETLLDPGSLPRATAVLGGDAMVEKIRGIAGHTIMPVSAAVVIGLGGTGVQTVARIKAAVDAGRIDQQAHDAVTFLAIDAVGTEKMQPPLPDGVGLDGELLNLTGFNAGAYLQGQRPVDRFLQQWWDEDYLVPPGELLHGLQRERMLGRLCFHQEVTRVRSMITQKMSEALGLRSDFLAAGHAGVQGAEIAVFIISSSVGGTGSSGFLEVLGAVHLVAQDLGVTAKIRPFLLLPGAFTTAIRNQQEDHTIGTAQRANAYAFFKELDHFIKHKTEFLEALGHKGHAIPEGADLVHSVYLFDSSVGGGARLNSVTDLYEIISESIYQLLFSTVGQAVLGANGVNIERVLREYDDFGKPRKYCSLGLGRVVFPGDTYRFHLLMWWSDWIVRAGFLKELSPDDVVALKDSDEVSALLERMAVLAQRSGEGQYDDLVRDFIDIGRDAPSTLKANPDPTNAQDVISEIEDMIPSVTLEIRRVLELLRPRVLDTLVSEIEGGVFASAGSVPRAQEIVAVLLRRLGEQLRSAGAKADAEITAKALASERLDEHLEDLAVAAGRNILEGAIASVVGLVKPDVVSTRDAAEELGNAIKDWTRSVVESELAEARKAYLVSAYGLVERLKGELDEARIQLEAITSSAKEYWERDVLIGKDAGPTATSVLIPADTLPEVEFSRLSRSLRETIGAEHAGLLEDEQLASLHADLVRTSATRGFFDLGSRDPLRQKRARDAVLNRLEQDALRYALETTDDEGNRRSRLPRDLVEAADELGERPRLVSALRGVEALSKEVCWNWEPGRFQLTGEGGEGSARAQDHPRVTSAVIAHSSIDALVAAEFDEPDSRASAPDPERLLALSVEWAVPLHCLPAVDRWREDYHRLRVKREAQRSDRPEIGVEPPSHIDRRFEAFDELVPEYFRPEGSAAAFVRGLAIAAALSSTETATATVALYQRDATRPAMSPLRQERGQGFVTRRVAVENGLLRPAEGGDKVLGTGWLVALRGVGLDIGLQKSIGACWDVVVQGLDPELLVEVVNTGVLPKINRKRRVVDPADEQALAHLRNAAEDLIDDLMTYV